MNTKSSSRFGDNHLFVYVLQMYKNNNSENQIHSNTSSYNKSKKKSTWNKKNKTSKTFELRVLLMPTTLERKEEENTKSTSIRHIYQAIF